MIFDSYRRKWKAFVVTFHPVPVIVAGAWKADHLPGCHILIPAVDWISKKALVRVPEDKFEEVLLLKPSSCTVPRSRPVMSSSLLASGTSANGLPPNVLRQYRSNAASAWR